MLYFQIKCVLSNKLQKGRDDFNDSFVLLQAYNHSCLRCDGPLSTESGGPSF